MASLKVLSALDTAKTQLYHFKAIIVAGMGLFTDAYDLFCIPPIMRLIGRVYYEHESEDHKYVIPPIITSTMVVIALLGTAIGQVAFGRLGDRIGRRRVYGVALIIMVLSSFGCGFSVCSTRWCVLLSLGLFRFILGIGIGGDYPLSATIMSEFSNYTTRGAFIAAVFSMQGFGILAASMVTMVVCAIFEHASDGVAEDLTPKDADFAWRLILMIGAIPAGLTFYWRMMMPETASSNLFQSKIYNHHLPMKEQLNAYQDAFQVAKFQAIIAACSTIPGYWFTVYFIDKVGRVKIQMMGFFFMALVYLALGIPYYKYWDKKPNTGFLVLYALTFFFANFGPNTTTFIVPAELFPARFRSTCHGISGATGKVGAIIGSVGFLWASHDGEGKVYPEAIGMTFSLIMLAIVCLLGMVVTFLFTRETMGRSLEENENDD
uniref:Major facilitator superfamily (MFS) profile domain-containing protein n=1 Tax=Quercus lobata TaxID=97700 RepID=A0A7N2QYJ1_QUELO